MPSQTTSRSNIIYPFSGRTIFFCFTQYVLSASFIVYHLCICRKNLFFRKRRMGCADWAPNQRQIIIVHSHSQTHLSTACRQEAIRRCLARQRKATAQPRVRAAQDVRSRCGRGNIASTGGTADNRTPLSGTDARQQSSSAAPPISRDDRFNIVVGLVVTTDNLFPQTELFVVNSTI